MARDTVFLGPMAVRN